MQAKCAAIKTVGSNLEQQCLNVHVPRVLCQRQESTFLSVGKQGLFFTAAPQEDNMPLQLGNILAFEGLSGAI